MVKRRKTRISGSSKLGWRIRDEYLYRHRSNGKNRRGGFNKAKDPISRWTDKTLKRKLNQVYGDS